MWLFPLWLWQAATQRGPATQYIPQQPGLRGTRPCSNTHPWRRGVPTPSPPDLPLTAQSGARSFFVLGAWVPAQLLAASTGAGGGNAPSKRPGIVTRSPRAPDPAGPGRARAVGAPERPAHALWTRPPTVSHPLRTQHPPGGKGPWKIWKGHLCSAVPQMSGNEGQIRAAMVRAASSRRFTGRNWSPSLSRADLKFATIPQSWGFIQQSPRAQTSAPSCEQPGYNRQRLCTRPGPAPGHRKSLVPIV